MTAPRPILSTLAPPTYITPAEHIRHMSGDPNFMTSLARGLAVISAFQERKRPLTIAQISHRTGIPRASVRRCLYTLIKLNFVAADGHTYSLLPKVLTLGHAYLSSTSLAVAAQPYLDQLSEQLHEACNMATLDGEQILYIARSAIPQRLISVDLSVGSHLPAYCTALGRVLLAAMDDASLHDFLGHADLRQKTSRTLSTPETLWECLQGVRQQGWCIIDQELEQGLRSLAVPVFNASGHVVAAINVGAHASRIGVRELEKDYLPTMLSASRDLSSQLFQTS